MPNMMVGLILRGDLRDDLVVQRRRVEEQPDAGHQRQDRAARQAEGMEHRQHVEQLVCRRERDPRFGLEGIGEQVPAATARPPSGVPSEPDVKRITAGWSASCRAQRPAPQQRRQTFSASVTPGADVLQPDEFGAGLSRRLRRHRRCPAFSTKARDDTTVRMAAVRMAAATLAGPAV